jgi:hypothetical protein
MRELNFWRALPGTLHIGIGIAQESPTPYKYSTKHDPGNVLIGHHAGPIGHAGPPKRVTAIKNSIVMFMYGSRSMYYV